jgi:hypothetical protein
VGASAADLPLLLGPDKGKGVSVRGKLSRSAGAAVYTLNVTNGSSGPLDGLMIQVNSNAFGLAPSNLVLPVGLLAPGASATAVVPMAFNPAKLAQPPASSRLQVRCAGLLLLGVWCAAPRPFIFLDYP